MLITENFSADGPYTGLDSLKVSFIYLNNFCSMDYFLIRVSVNHPVVIKGYAIIQLTIVEPESES
jgi:hypothetical protein